jgi:hypothetical protein
MNEGKGRFFKLKQYMMRNGRTVLQQYLGAARKRVATWAPMPCKQIRLCAAARCLLVYGFAVSLPNAHVVNQS